MTPGVLLNCSLSYILSQGLSLNPELTNLISLISQHAARSPCGCLPNTGVEAGYHARPAFTQVLRPSSGPQAYTARLYPLCHLVRPHPLLDTVFHAAQGSLELMISFPQFPEC